MTRLQANLLLLLTAMIWGLSFVAQQTGMTGVGPFLFTGTRFWLGALVVLPLAMRETAHLGRRLGRRDWTGFAVAGVALFAGAILQQIGIQTTTVTNAGFLTVLYVPIVSIGGFAILHQHPHWSVWPAGLACVIGTYLLSGARALAIGSGEFLELCGAFFWAAHVHAVGYFGRKSGTPVTLACVQFAVAGTLGLAWALVTEPVTPAGLAENWIEIAYSGAASAGLGFTFQVIAQRHTSPAEAAVLLSSETLFAALAGAVILGERLMGGQWLGGGLVFIAICAVQVLPLATPRGGKFAPRRQG